MSELTKKYLDELAVEALVTNIKAEDAKVLAAAKKYTDEAPFDAAGSAITAETNAKAHADQKVQELANGQVKLNKEAIEVLNGEGEGSVKKAVADAQTTLQGNIDGVDAKAVKNAEDIAAEILRAKAAEEANATAASNAQAKGEEALAHSEALAAKVGEVPEGSTVMGIITNIQENAYDDTDLRADMATELDKKADKTQVATDIANAVATETAARESAVAELQGAVNTLSGTHATDKKALEDAIALKADQTALNDLTNAAATKTALQEEVERAQGEEARIEGLVTAEATKAREEEGKLANRIKAVEDDYLKAADKEELQGNIDEVSGKVTTLIGEDANKSVRTIANEELAKQLVAEGAKEALDSLEEIAAWIQAHPDDAAAMNKAIEDLEALVGELPSGVTATTIVGYIAEVKADLQGKIDELNAKKQDVITEIGMTSAIKTATGKDITYDKVISTDVIDFNDIIELHVIGSYSYLVTGEDPAYDYYTWENFEHNLNNYGGYYDIICDKNGILVHVGDPDCLVINSIDITYKTQAENQVVKKEHLPADVVYQGALDTTVASLNSSNTTLRNELTAEINKKANASDVEGLAGTVAGIEAQLGENGTTGKAIADLQAAVATKAEAQALTDAVATLQGVDAGQETRLQALEAKFDGDDSVSNLIATAKQEAINTAAGDATTKANKALDDAKAYANGLSGNYATAAQGALADSALQKADITTGSANGTIAVEGTDVAVKGLGSAAYVDTTAFDAAGVAEEKVNALANGQVKTNKEAIEAINNAETGILKQSKDYTDAQVKALADGQVNTNKEAIAALTTKHNEDKATLEEAIAANTSKINSFVAISVEQINSMFA